MRNIDIARAAEESALAWLKRFGYLTSYQLAMLLADKSRHKSKAAVIRLAQYTLKRLETGGFVVSKKQTCHPSYYALSLAGCRRINVDVKFAKDALRYITNHRNWANSVAVFSHCQEDVFWTEKEILRGLAPFKVLGGKVPDAIYRRGKSYAWVEVEASKKSNKDLRNTVNWLLGFVFPPFFDTENDEWSYCTPAVSGSNGAVIGVVMFMAVDKTAASLRKRMEAEAVRLNKHEQLQQLLADERVLFYSEVEAQQLLTFPL